MGRFLPPDHTAGDERTVGGYAAVHGRPAAIDGSDGASYSLDILVDATEDAAEPFAAYIVFLRWRRIGPQGVEGHLETEYLAWGETAAEAATRAGALTLDAAREELERSLAQHRPPTERRWYDVMRDPDPA
ncbi:MAG: hypothetical protein K2X99_03370 [Gemmatimonadaceae bacterium]|nr:hypothetical protein [Gemmatimonadaceae bacterium]